MNTQRLFGCCTVLLLALTVVMQAQTPRTINYQGRAKDQAGYLNGPKDITLKIYDQAAGGGALFTETQSVNFSNGIYTVVIGGATSGGIPATVDFGKTYWLGVAIEGFNNDQEIAPRLQFHSAASSIRAIVADSANRASTAINAKQATKADSADVAVRADVATQANTAKNADSARIANKADTAKELIAPATIAATPQNSEPVLTVVSLEAKTGVGLVAGGDRYAIISSGVDSTREHYVAGGNAAASAPAIGGYYRDNAPIAWGLIDDDGAILSDFGILRVNAAGAGIYEVTLNNSVSTVPVKGGVVPAMSVAISIEAQQGELQPTIASWSFKPKSGGTGVETNVIVVLIRTTQGEQLNRRFALQVFGRP
ncbi:MAG: hypothetical protein IT211_07260 [Armatimonadetes bacterium]|nr:hypothetical protein [Armatimonadota bacterium]